MCDTSGESPKPPPQTEVLTYKYERIRLRACKDYYKALDKYHVRLSSRRFPFRRVSPLIEFAVDLRAIIDKTICYLEGLAPELFADVARDPLLVGLYRSLSALEETYKILLAIPEYDEALWLQGAFSQYLRTQAAPQVAKGHDVILLPEWGHFTYSCFDFVAAILTHFLGDGAYSALQKISLQPLAKETEAIRNRIRSPELKPNPGDIAWAVYLLWRKMPSLGIIRFPLELSSEFYFHNIIFHELGHYVQGLLAYTDPHCKISESWDELFKKHTDAAIEAERPEATERLRKCIIATGIVSGLLGDEATSEQKTRAAQTLSEVLYDSTAEISTFGNDEQLEPRTIR